jgi:hypothetical protein
MLTWTLAGAGCGRAINPLVIEDARLAARVKTALVNDDVVGVRAIEVVVQSGVARLSGSVTSDGERRRAIDLARSVDGIIDVRADLTIRPDGTEEPEVAAGRATAPPLVDDLDPDREAGRTLLAVGVAIRQTYPGDEALDRAVTVGPLVRLGSGRGLGLGFGFGWYTADLALGSAPLGRLRVRPVMAGLAYTIGGDRVSLGLSMVGGIAFNSLAGRRESPGPVWALDVRDSFAWRPGASLWIELGPRMAFNLSGGYLVTRPRLALLDDGREVFRHVRGDAAIVNTGLVYKLF